MALAAHDHKVTVQNAGLDHAFTLHGQDEHLVAAHQILREHVVFLNVLLRQNRHARRHPADQRHAAPSDRRRVRQLQRARLCRVAADVAFLLQSVQVRVYRGGRFQPDRQTDFTNRGRIALVVNLPANEIQNLHFLFGRVAHAVFLPFFFR